MKIPVTLYVGTAIGVSLGVVVSSILMNSFDNLSIKIYYLLVGIGAMAASDWWTSRK